MFANNPCLKQMPHQRFQIHVLPSSGLLCLVTKHVCNIVSSFLFTLSHISSKPHVVRNPYPVQFAMVQDFFYKCKEVTRVNDGLHRHHHFGERNLQVILSNRQDYWRTASAGWPKTCHPCVTVLTSPAINELAPTRPMPHCPPTLTTVRSR